jgi:hypothetical protein
MLNMKHALLDALGSLIIWFSCCVLSVYRYFFTVVNASKKKV